MTEDELLELQSYARGHFLPYCVLTDEKYEINWHLEVIGKALEDAERRIREGGAKQLFLILELPPRHGKSELTSIRFPTWFLGRNPDKHVITSSYSGDLSQDFGAKARNLVRSAEYSALFPEVTLSEDTQAKTRWLTSKGGSYTSVGIGGTVTGRGAHCLIIDDPHSSRKEADSQTIRNNVWEWFRSTAYSRLEPNGVVIIIMQRWHKDDLVGRILTNFEGRSDIDIVEIKFPAIATKDELYRKSGEALWPWKYPADALQTIQGTLGGVNWASQYQQEPILQENATFKPEWFKYFDEKDLEGKELVYTVTVDLATGDKEVKNGDFVSIHTVAKEKTKPEWYVIDSKIERLDPLQTCDYLFYLYLKYRFTRLGIETNAYQKTFKFWLTEEMKKRGVYMPIQEIKSTSSKIARINGLAPLYQAGVVYHRRDYLELESQLLNFPQGEHDDGPDSLAMQLEVIGSSYDTHSSPQDVAKAVDNMIRRRNNSLATFKLKF